ncbi:VanZ family protein [Qaidamihabitans albus]|uniref:VanZ family protein n=1 Tax=Qaidamihabitans albus TaxID=2795733 RepID=UPI0018F1A283|nr:VanZ family protein [Qaidamihabitans albus]
MTTAQETSLLYGTLGFLVVWGTLLVPQLIGHHARFGRVRPKRVAVLAVGTLYGCLALAVVLLPLPDPGRPRLEQTTQLVPFQWVSDIGAELSRYGEPVSHALLTLTFQQATMNVLLFVPLGIFARLLWRQGFARAALLGLGASLLIEITQLTANFGTAPFVYRIFDVDDLMNNTVGAMLGWVAAALFVALRKIRRAAAAPNAPATRPVPAGRPHRAAPAAPACAAHAAAGRVAPPAAPSQSRR